MKFHLQGNAPPEVRADMTETLQQIRHEPIRRRHVDWVNAALWIAVVGVLGAFWGLVLCLALAVVQ